jgi:hypothetical protein
MVRIAQRTSASSNPRGNLVDRALTGLIFCHRREPLEAIGDLEQTIMRFMDDTKVITRTKMELATTTSAAPEWNWPK